MVAVSCHVFREHLDCESLLNLLVQFEHFFVYCDWEYMGQLSEVAPSTENIESHVTSLIYASHDNFIRDEETDDVSLSHDDVLKICDRCKCQRGLLQRVVLDLLPFQQQMQ